MTRRSSPWGRPGAVACAVGALAVAVYANTLGHGFAGDDLRVIVDNPAARDPGDWRRILTTPSWFMEGEATTAFRPLATWTFAVEHALHGGHPFGHHAVNVLLHAAAAMLLVLLAAATGLAGPVGAFAGALFAVHPIHTEVVANGVGRAELLAAVFALAALLVARGARGATHPGRYVLATACYGLALLSKEHAIVLLVLLPLADLVVEDGASLRRFRGRLRGGRVGFYGGLAATTVAYLGLRVAAVGSLTGALAVGDRVGVAYNPTLVAPAGLRILTALGVQARALWLLVWPMHLSADYSYRETTVASGVGDPAAIAGIAVAAAMVVGAVLAWRRRPLATFWLALALLPWTVVSNLVVPIGTIFGERLLYLPSAGACVLLAMAVVGAMRSAGRRSTIGVASAVLVVWSVRTVARNPVWASDLALAEATVRDAPHSAPAHANLGRVYVDLRRDAEALACFETAAGLLADHPEWPERLDVLYETALLEQRRGDAAAARRHYGEIVARDPRYFPAWINLGVLANQAGDHRVALDAAERAAAVRPDLPNADLVRGVALRGLGRHRDALGAFRAVLDRAPGAPDALLGVGASAFAIGDFTEAARAFETLVGVAPSRDAYLGLVLSLRRVGRAADARRAAEQARTRYPDEAAFQPTS